MCVSFEAESVQMATAAGALEFTNEVVVEDLVLLEQGSTAQGGY